MTLFGRNFHFETPLDSIVDVVVPDGDQWTRFGHELVAAFGRGVGPVPSVRSASALAGFSEYPKGNRILIGTVHTNPLIAWLYRRKHTLVDDFYPGAGGWVIQTVHNPSSIGFNAVVLGLSDPAMCPPLLAAFREVLASSGGALGYLNCVETRLDIPRLSDGERRVWKRRARAAFRANTGRDAIERGIESGLVYALTGFPEYLELFVFSMRHYHKLVHQAGGEWEFEHMLFPYAWIWRLAWLWDMIEESPLLSDEDRLELIEVLHGLRGYTSNLVYFRDPGLRRPAIRQNHPTFAALSLFFAGRYFRDYYDDQTLDTAMETARLIFEGQRDSFKPDDDANGYCWLVPSHLLTYDLAHDDFRFVRNGQLRQVCEYAELTTDNMLSPVGFGDATRYYPPRWCSRQLRFLLTAAAAFERNGAFLRLLTPIPPSAFDLTPRHGELQNYLVDSVGHYALDLELGPAVLAPGCQVAPLSDGAFQLVVGKRTSVFDPFRPAGGSTGRVSPDQSFDKMALRGGYQADDEYLLLDGVSGFVHDHEDVGSVLRLTWMNRMWLTEGDYIRSLPKFHNSLVCIRNGESRPMPELASLHFRYEIDRTGFYQVRMSDCNGVTWRRTISWRRGCWFLFTDSIEVLREGEYLLALHWRLLGRVRSSQRSTTSRQSGVLFRITHGDGSVKSISNEPSREIRIHTGSFFHEYPHAGDPTRVLRQERRLPDGTPGQRIAFFNLMTCGDGESVDAWTLKPISEGVVRLRSKKGSEQRTIRDGPWQESGWETDAELSLIDRTRIQLIHCRRFRLGSRTVGFSRPVCLEIEPGNCAVRVIANECAQVTGDLFVTVRSIGQGESQLALGAPVADWPVTGRSTQKAKPTGPSVVRSRSKGAGRLIVRNFVDRVDRPAAMVWSGQSSRFFVVGTSGRVEVFGPTGQQLAFPLGGRKVTAVCPVAIKCEEGLLVGGAGFLALHDASNTRLWAVDLPLSHYRVQRVNDLKVAVLDPQKETAASILIGTDGWLVHCFDLAGQRRWERQIHHHAARSLQVGDVDGDGRKEILVGTEYHTSDLLESDGSIRWTISGGPEFVALGFCDLDRDGIKESIYGAESGMVTAVDSKTGAILWNANLGDRAHLARMLNCDDGGQALVVGSICGELARLDQTGRKVWRHNLGSDLLALESSSGGREVIVVTRDGAVARIDVGGAVLFQDHLGSPLVNAVAAGRSGGPDGFFLATEDGRILRLDRVG